MQNNYSSVGVVIDEETEDLQFCSTCAANGEMNKLKERIWLDSAREEITRSPRC